MLIVIFTFNISTFIFQSGYEEVELYNYPSSTITSRVWNYFMFRKKIGAEGPPVKENLDMEYTICILCKKAYKFIGECVSAQTTTGWTPNRTAMKFCPEILHNSAYVATSLLKRKLDLYFISNMVYMHSFEKKKKTLILSSLDKFTTQVKYSNT